MHYLGEYKKIANFINGVHLIFVRLEGEITSDCLLSMVSSIDEIRSYSLISLIL
jgi:hypothetical protein